VTPSPESGKPRLVATSRQRKTMPDTSDGSIAPDEVRLHAYYLSLERGDLPPDPIGDWLRAESELSTGGRSANSRG
jgi:hypothetical protein